MSTFYVAPTGSNSNPGTLSFPKQTIAQGVALLSAGDTLLIRAGVYPESLVDSVPSGTSWTVLTRIAAYAGETVWLTPAGGSYGIRFSGTQHYIEFDGLNVDGTATGSTVTLAGASPNDVHHLRFKNAELIGGRDAIWCATVCGGAYSEFQNLRIHGGAENATGGLCGPGCSNYAWYSGGDGNLVENCDIYDTASIGIQIYNGSGGTPTGNIIRNNRIHGLSRSGYPGHDGNGILISGNSNQIYNNVFYDCTWSGGGNGIDVYSGTGNQIWNNTVYGIPGTGIKVESGAVATSLTNNIIYGQTGTAIVDSGSGTTQTTNLTTNPLFVNAGAGDFRLTATSPAINSGTAVPIATDIVGTARPQGSAYDRGAYEYTTVAPPPTQTFYVAKTGNDGNSGSATAPKLTIAAGVALLHTGDTLVIHAGVYAESIRNSVITGTDWTTPTRVMANPGDTVWLTPTLDEYAIFFDRTVHHIEFTGINLDASHCTLGAVVIVGWTGGNAHHIRLQDAVVLGNRGFAHHLHCAASTSGVTGGNEFLRLRVSGGGATELHDGIRLESASNLVSGCDLTDLPGIAVHVVADGDTPSTNTLTANQIHDLRATSTGQAHYGIKLDSGSGNIVTNNVVWNVPDDGGASIGIDAYGGSAAAIYHNTVTACDEGIAIEAGHSGALVKNNIAYSNTTNQFRDSGGSFAEVTRVVGGFPASASTIPATAFVATAGNLLVAAFWPDNGSVSSVADTAGNTWHVATTGGGQQWAIYYAYNCLGHAANVVTATLSGATVSRAFMVRQFSGVPTTDPLLDGDNAIAESTAPATPALTIALAAVVVEAVFGLAGGVGDSGPFTLATWDIPADPVFTSAGTFGDAIAVSSTDVTPQATCNFAFWMIAAAAFKTSGVGATTATNLFTDPSFVNAASGNFRLRTGSAAIDTGTNVGVTVDADGRARPVNAVYDIGAYEYAAAATVKRLTMMGVGR